ncbi:putative oxidoreductase [Serratia liquefaciens]|nr:putative oxidoreductase [Serratia liquefaciens]
MLTGKHIKNMTNSNLRELYTSGRAGNESSWLYQFFGRALGTNNFSDGSSMCHEASGYDMPQSRSIGKGIFFDNQFFEAHIQGVDTTSWVFIERQSGLSEAQIGEATRFTSRLTM